MNTKLSLTRKQKTMLRTFFLGITILNQILSSSGAIANYLPNENAILVYNIASACVTAIASIMAWWFNNSVTEAAQLADAYLDTIKEKKKEGLEQ